VRAQFAQYQNYEQTLPQRNVVTQLAQSLSYTGTPLQDAQVAQLVNILAANTPAQNQNASGLGGCLQAWGGGFGNPNESDHRRRNHPGPIDPDRPQVTALQQLQAQQQAQRQIAQMMRQGNAGGTAPSSSAATLKAATTEGHRQKTLVRGFGRRGTWTFLPSETPMIVTTAQLFKHAYGKYAVGAYNINNAEQAMGLFRGCIQSQAPFIIQISKGARNTRQENARGHHPRRR